MVCPSLKPRSSLGVESGACACLVNSVSCFTHLDKMKKGDEMKCKRIKEELNKLERINSSSCILEVVLKGQIEVEGIASVSKANAYECTAT